MQTIVLFIHHLNEVAFQSKHKCIKTNVDCNETFTIFFKEK